MLKNSIKFMLVTLVSLFSLNAFATLEIVSITFNKNTWQSNLSPRKYIYNSYSGAQEFDLKALVNDEHSMQNDVRSYVLAYDKSYGPESNPYLLGGGKNALWNEKLALNGAILAGLEVRVRGTEQAKFQFSMGGNKSNVYSLPRGTANYKNTAFTSLQIKPPLNTPFNGSWKLNMLGGEADINQIVLHIYTNGKSCLRNLCGKYKQLVGDDIVDPGYLVAESINGFGFKVLYLLPNKYTFQFVNIPENASHINLHIIDPNRETTSIDFLVPFKTFSEFPDKKSHIVVHEQYNLSIYRGKKIVARAIKKGTTDEVVMEKEFMIE